ncbi:MAG: hypothetical protein VYC39_13000 [Myxococcota bacterium]|nr:hypothetical protein [Myxococcota bacterium]
MMCTLLLYACEKENSVSMPSPPEAPAQNTNDSGTAERQPQDGGVSDAMTSETSRDAGEQEVKDAQESPNEDASSMTADSSESDAGILEDADIPDIGFIEDANIIDGGFVEDAAILDVGLLQDARPSLDIGPADSGFADTGLQRDSGHPLDAATSLYERPIVGNGAPLATLNNAGNLEYRRYANQGQTSEANILPDFSYAGYQGGGVAIPDVAVQETLSPVTGDNLAQIQAAIDRVSQLTPDSNGFRGAVLLTRGQYDLSDTLTISTSGVVLRGEGQDANGTILVATRRAQHNLIELRGAGNGFNEISGTRVRITTATVAVGSTNFQVESNHQFNQGDTVVILRTPNQHWIDTLGMGPYGWTPNSYRIGHERIITQVDGTRIWINIPIVDTIESDFGGGSVFAANMNGRLSNTGVEDLRLVSEYTGSTDEDHAWVGIWLNRVTNSWVRRVTVKHFGFAAVRIRGESNFNSVEDTAMLDPISQISGGRRYPFVVDDGLGNLFQRCYSREGRHNFVTGSRVTGPNVWLDSLAVQSNSDDGPHHRWATGLLFDNTSGGPLNVQNRTTSGTGHGWAGAQTLFWNASATTMICDSPIGAMNWTIGSNGTRRQSSYSPNEADCWTESHGTAVLPRSLYLQQLEDRLGSAAVEAITLPAQRVGSIETYLENWAGESRLDALLQPDPMCSRGVRSGQTCCANSCGTCGGTGCSQRPGGAESCCSGRIQMTARSCASFPPPCVLP